MADVPDLSALNPEHNTCPKCLNVGTVIIRRVVWLGDRHVHGHCHACGHVWVRPADENQLAN